ncbi:MAG TPA: alpha/beta hydrolase [Solirubrobacteraceae bacterium]|jgi:pimeloyl-ACP methyl ester carboxylesterase
MEFRTIAGEGEQRYVVSQRGEGPDVVLLHGFPDTPWSWSQIEETLVNAGWRVTVPWLRGYHEETIVPGRGYDPESIGGDALGLLDAIGVSRAVMVGHDWGALATYVAAALAPERVQAIVTMGIPHPSLLKPSPASLWAVRHFFALKLPWSARTCRRNDFAYLDRLCRRWSPGWSGPEREETLRRAKEALSSPATLEGAIAYYRALPLGGQPPALRRVPRVTGLVIGGEHDLGDGSMLTRTAELLGSPSRALIVPGAGHWPQRENAAVVVPELLEFMTQLDS